MEQKFSKLIALNLRKVTTRIFKVLASPTTASLIHCHFKSTAEKNICREIPKCQSIPLVSQTLSIFELSQIITGPHIWIRSNCSHFINYFNYAHYAIKDTIRCFLHENPKDRLCSTKHVSCIFLTTGLFYPENCKSFKWLCFSLLLATSKLRIKFVTHLGTMYNKNSN